MNVQKPSHIIGLLLLVAFVTTIWPAVYYSIDRDRPRVIEANRRTVAGFIETFRNINQRYPATLDELIGETNITQKAELELALVALHRERLQYQRLTNGFSLVVVEPSHFGRTNRIEKQYALGDGFRD